MFLSKLKWKIPWFRRKNGEFYSTLEEETGIEMTKHGDKNERNYQRERETTERCLEDLASYGSLDNEKKAEIPEEKLTTWQASWNITNMIQVKKKI
jgi:hypothetical protein